jgi:hypothetical protein
MKLSQQKKYKGGARRSRTPAQWQQERARLMQRYIVLTDSIESFDDDFVNLEETLPNLPAYIFDEYDLSTKDEVFKIYVTALARGVNPDYSNNYNQSERVAIAGWLNTLPYQAVEEGVELANQAEEIRAELVELEHDLESLGNTEAVEGTLADSDTDMEGYGRPHTRFL